MSVSTLIQWADDTVNPIMGCQAPCELRPSAQRACEVTLDFLADHYPGKLLSELKPMVEEYLQGMNASEIYQSRDQLIDTLAGNSDFPSTLGNPATLKKAYKAELDKIYICYAHQQTLMRGSDITKPEKWVHPGFPEQFEKLQKFPGRMAAAAMRPDLWMQPRPTKPWLNYLPRLFFVSDMGDALSSEIDFKYLKEEIIDVVSSPRGRLHIWLWLTKIPKRMAEFGRWLQKRNIPWPDNLVAMTSVTSSKTVVRAEQLKNVPAKLKGLSVEPLWEQVDLPLEGIDWCIVGGQSGPGSRPFDLQWIREIRTQCQASGTALFVKQLGAKPCLDNIPIPRLLDKHGGDWNEWPSEFQIRDVPEGFRLLR